MDPETKSDAQLRKDIEDELACEPSVDADALGVAAKDGIVTLSGHVSSYAEKVAAERAAARVLGVKAVVTEMDVKLPGSSRLTDEDIAHAAVNALSAHALLPGGRIKVQVGSGWVTLEGDVDWQYQKAAAQAAISHLRGVTGVTDHIVVKPASIRDAVQSHIEAALQRTFGGRTSHIRVETRRDHVTLWGTVASLAERSEAERAAWNTPGVCHVENRLSVSVASASGAAAHNA
jgi:VCBS repeat-containing protein